MTGLYSAKAWYTRRLGRVLRWCVDHQVSPNTLTIFGVLCAAAALPAIAYGWWPLAGLLVAGRLAGANLDGAIARERDVSSPRGFVANELGDRASDFLLAGGLVAAAHLTPGASTGWAWAALAAASFPTFVSLSVCAAGGTRINGGPFGKTERCLAYVIASVFAALAVGAALTIICVVVVLGSVLTGLRRWKVGVGELAETRNGEA